jgi:3-methylcrotonyl-CoA carboxylase alpha subunit
MQHQFRFNSEVHEVTLERTPKIWAFANHCAHPKEDGRVRIYFEDGKKAWAHVAKVGDVWWIHHSGNIYTLERIEPGASADEQHGGLVAPMPGTVLEVLVSEGQTVEAGQTLMILEAMKMEHRVVASEDGTVTKVSFSAGDRVEQGASLLEIESNQ